VALDGEGMFVCELDGDVLLANAWELALELVRVCGLGDVEAGRKRAPLVVAGGREAVVKEAQQRRKVVAAVARGRGTACLAVDGEEQRHVVWWYGFTPFLAVLELTVGAHDRWRLWLGW